MHTSSLPVALITGGARRVGAAIVEHLHQAHFNVLIHCHTSQQEAGALAMRLNTIRPASAWVLTADLCQKKAVVDMMRQGVHWAGRLDVLVNNASIFVRDHYAVWDHLWTTNVQAPWWCSMEAFAHLSLHAGCLINITDIHAEHPLKDYAIYSQTKAALLMQTKALAREFAPHVRVNAVAPGAMAWPEDDNVLSVALQKKIMDKTLLKRHGDPLYVAQAVLSLVRNPFITGQSLRVDGGRCLG